MGWRSYPLIDERSEPDAFAPPKGARASTPVITADSLPAYRHVYDTGEKFFGGFGDTLLLTEDYWTMRARSSQVFERNLYGRGVIKRMITNTINTGLFLESEPEERVLGRQDRSLQDWSEDVENRFALWASDPWLCDHIEQRTFGQIQAAAEMEALISGDVLVVVRQHSATKLPRIQLVRGDMVVSSLAKPRNGNRVDNGVELDAQGRHVGYWVRQRDGTTARIPAWGEKSGRRIAWLHYGCEKRLDKVRGTPLLKMMLQSIQELDKYRDASLRKMVITSMIAGFIEKTEAKPGSAGMLGAAIRKDVLVQGRDSDGAQKRELPITQHIPGIYMQELQHGEKPQVYRDTGAVDSYKIFEEAIVDTIAWSYEIPPEILRLGFGNNYSASQAAINEFKLFLNRRRTDIGASLCQPIYVEWLVAAALAGKVQAQGLIESWRDTSRYDEFAAWTHADWSGHIKPAVDLSKLVRGYKESIDEGLCTRQRAARELYGIRYSKAAKQLITENEQLKAAREALGVAPDGSAPVAAPDADAEEEGERDGNAVAS